MKKKNDRWHERGYPILIAEDDPDLRQLLKNTLIKAGHEVLSVENGQRALEIFNDRFFPIILTDWIMPGVDGLELCGAIRKNPSSGYVYIIILTAKDSIAEIVTGLEAGADDYLTKPFHRTELIARLNTAKRILDLERTLKRANEEIKLLTITDPLTGSYNRGYLTERMPKEIKRARRYQHPLSLILCDIDNFKRINDTYGHEAGNCVIKAFFNCINNSIRNGVDWVARYGGEEFIVVLPETNTASALILAERLRVHVSQNIIKVNENDVQITASFGAAGFEPTKNNDKITLEAMVNQADNYLYQCKMEGRNRVKGSSL